MAQATRIARTVRARAPRFTAAIPNTDPTETCVVETGRPSRFAPATSRAVNEVGGEPLSGAHRGDLPAHRLGHPAGVEDAADGHHKSDRGQAQRRVDHLAGQQEGNDLRRVVQPAGEPDRPVAEEVQPVHNPSGVGTQYPAAVAFNAPLGPRDLHATPGETRASVPSGSDTACS